MIGLALPWAQEAVREAALDLLAWVVLGAASWGGVYLVGLAVHRSIEFVRALREEVAAERRARARARHAAALATAPRCPATRPSIERDPDAPPRWRCELPEAHDGSHFSRGAWWAS